MLGQTNFLDEIIVDNFAGGGGASTGIELAMGRPVTIAINHDPDAILMHKTNHPHTLHLCESVWDVDPVAVCEGRPVGLAWFSPDCKHFSKAKGGKPVEKEIRGLAWVAVRWAATVRPRVMILENVEEFKTWGPLKGGYPDPKQKGRTFRSFVNALQKHGYDVDWRELRACDYGAPTIRKRFFLVARCDGQPIVWPEPTHGPAGSGLKPYRTAAEIIDWTLPCPSIFDTAEEIQQKYGIRAIRPLAEKTMNRIARGIQKFVVDCPDPYIVQTTDETISPVMTAIGQTGFSGDRSYGVAEPIRTVVSKAEQCLIAPNLIQYHSETADGEARGQRISDPMLTIDAAPRYGLVTSHMCVLRNHQDGRDWGEPMPTIATSPGHFAEVRAFLTKYYGAGVGQDAGEPLGTVVGRDRFGIVTIHGTEYTIEDIGLRMLTPRELYNAQGFPSDYVIDQDYTGKKYPKSKQVARCGNAVPPPFAEALVRANLPELCGKRYGSMAELEKEIAV